MEPDLHYAQPVDRSTGPFNSGLMPPFLPTGRKSGSPGMIFLHLDSLRRLLPIFTIFHPIMRHSFS